jgi:hypothetical protein
MLFSLVTAHASLVMLHASFSGVDATHAARVPGRTLSILRLAPAFVPQTASRIRRVSCPLPRIPWHHLHFDSVELRRFSCLPVGRLLNNKPQLLPLVLPRRLYNLHLSISKYMSNQPLDISNRILRIHANICSLSMSILSIRLLLRLAGRLQTGGCGRPCL